MNKIKNIAIAIGLIVSLGLSIQMARAADCENGSFSEQREAFEKIEGVVVTQLNADQIASMVAKVGQPPNAVGDFEAYLVANSPLAAVFIVQNGCTTDRLGPAREDNINSILGIVKARLPAQGERVD